MVKLQKFYYNMTPSQKLEAFTFGSSIVVTAVLVTIGFLFGFKTLLLIIAAIAGLLLLALIILFAKPFCIARRIYKTRPPRKAYEEISSRDGYCRLDTLPQALISSVICAEDIRFYRHKGIDYSCLLKAVAHYMFTDMKPVGASTITQQTIKNIYLTPEAEMLRKTTEMLMVRRMEKELSKDQILELYLNVIYYGCGQTGIRDAARYYYDTTPEHLTFDQCVSLACILPCPDKYNKAASPLFFQQRKRKVLGALFLDMEFPYSEMKLES